jgi:predicted nucleic acid-binding protein
VFVFDCSIISSWLLPDEENHISEEIMKNFLLKENPTIKAPCIFYTEIMNVLQVAYRRQRIDKNLKESILQSIMQLPVIIDNAGMIPSYFPDIAVLATKHQLSSYDALYLELAIRQNIPLITLDKALRQAAKAENVLHVI